MIIISLQVNTDVLHITCNLRYSVPKEITVIFHDGLNYEYHFNITELAEEFKGEFRSLGENTEKYKAFSVLIRKEIKETNINLLKIKIFR